MSAGLLGVYPSCWSLAAVLQSWGEGQVTGKVGQIWGRLCKVSSHGCWRCLQALTPRGLGLGLGEPSSDTEGLGLVEFSLEAEEL